MDGEKCYDRDSDTQVIDKIVIRYKKDQWSPLNTDGKKCYDRDFLITLQSNPKCKKKPDNLPDLEIVLKDTRRARLDPRSYTLTCSSEVLMPVFHKSSSQRGPLPKRNSQQGKAGINGGKSNTIQVTSLKEDVELRETETAWRPARVVATQNITEDEIRTAELYKKVRDVLNKLTEEKFESLLNQVRVLSIDNEERLQGVIDLVFEKAVDEPIFFVACALLCKELALMQVPTNKEEQQFVNFRKLLIAKCQIEFEKNSIHESARNLKLKEIDDCMDPEKKMDLQALLEKEDRRMRVKSIGNIRFIGELFKQQMITVKIMLRCINILLDNKDEDSLECLCKLLTTIGKDLELTKNQSLQTYFNTMQEIVDKKDGKISSRVRFMLQDVIDLRNSNWDLRRARTSSELMNKSPLIDEITFGLENLFSNWGRGSNIKTPQPHATITNTANMYAALENIAPEQEKNRAYETVAALLANDEFIDKLVDNVTQRLDKKLQDQKAFNESADYKVLKDRLDQLEQNFRRNYIRPDQIGKCHQTGTDDFSSMRPTTPTGFVPHQTSNQPTNQGPSIREMAQSGPPNQSSTPPQNDINKMQPPQPGQLQMTFISQQVHSAQPNYFRPPALNQGGPWMSNYQRQTMTSTAAAAPALNSQHMTYPTYQVPLKNYAQPPFYTTQSYPTMFPSQYMQSTYRSQQPQYLQGTPIQMTARQGVPPVPPRNAPSTQQQKPVMSAPAPVPAAPPKQQLNSKQLKLRMRNIMEEYLNDCCTLKECESDIKARIDQSKLQEFVIQGYNGVLKRSATTRCKAGKLFAYLTKNQTLSNDDMCKALTEVLSQADDLEIDIPKLWDYLAEMILPLVMEGVVPLDKLRSCSAVLVSQGHAHKLIAPLLKQLVADNGPNYVVELWQTAGVQFTDFMSADIVDSYVKENHFDFLLGSWNHVHSRLLQFFKSNTTLRTITDWIYENVGDRVKKNQFIRTLVAAVIENAVYNVNGVMKLRSELLTQHYLLLQRFVDNQKWLELQCLFGLQALIHKWKHPPDLLLSIFERFWEDGLVSKDSFLAWEKCTDPAEQEGKCEALKSLQSFFMSLKEAEDDSGSSISDEA